MSRLRKQFLQLSQFIVHKLFVLKIGTTTKTGGSLNDPQAPLASVLMSQTKENHVWLEGKYS